MNKRQLLSNSALITLHSALLHVGGCEGSATVALSRSTFRVSPPTVSGQFCAYCKTVALGASGSAGLGVGSGGAKCVPLLTCSLKTQSTARASRWCTCCASRCEQ